LSKTAIITGVLGQDGSYLTEYLLELGYIVFGIHRRISTEGSGRFDNISSVINNPRLRLIPADICDFQHMTFLIRDLKPTEFYSLAAMSHVGHSFSEEVLTHQTNATAVAAMLNAIAAYSPVTRFYQASTSELYGGMSGLERLSEDSPMRPNSPYAIAKLSAFHSARNYRERKNGLFAVNGILFNHESPRRGLDFAPRKITRGVASIKLGLQNKLCMGNMTARRDIGSAKEYVRGMHHLLSLGAPVDAVIATGKAPSIWDLLEFVCHLADLKPEDVYQEDPRFMRPSDVQILVGDNSKITSLGFHPKVKWEQTLQEMYEHDYNALLKGK